MLETNTVRMMDPLAIWDLRLLSETPKQKLAKTASMHKKIPDWGPVLRANSRQDSMSALHHLLVIAVHLPIHLVLGHSTEPIDLLRLRDNIQKTFTFYFTFQRHSSNSFTLVRKWQINIAPVQSHTDTKMVIPATNYHQVCIFPIRAIGPCQFRYLEQSKSICL